MIDDKAFRIIAAPMSNFEQLDLGRMPDTFI